MKLAFISNFLNHHQLELCLGFKEICDFKFIATMTTPNEQSKLGYDEMNNFDFVIRYYQDEQSRQLAKKIIDESDVIIAGSCTFPFELIEERLKQNKVTFWFSERLFKQKNPLLRFYPLRMFRVFKQCTKYKDRKFYLLAAGAYTAGDYAFLGAFKNKSFKWGYFPYFETIDINKIISKQMDKKISILWTGRFLPLKRPDYAVKLAVELKKKGIDFGIKMIGTGPEFNRIKENVEKLGLEKRVILTGAMPFKQVREEMKKAQIFLFTSDKNEGWGAVLNEAMNSGCAVICYNKIGSVPYLVKDNENGSIFNQRKEFFEKTFKLIYNYQFRTKLALNAYETIKTYWNGKIAAKRFNEFCVVLLQGEKQIFENGIMSKAE